VTRYFRSTPDIYSLVCGQLDSSYGYPNESTKTQRTLPPASELPSDAEGRVYLAVDADYCDFILPAAMLPQLLGSGAVEEVGEAAYLQSLPQAAGL
jgi:hypothetical protein